MALPGAYCQKNHPAVVFSENVSLKSFNTFGLEASARYFCTVQTENELAEALAFATKKGLPQLILGGGSNILLTKDFDGVVIHIANKGITLRTETHDQVYVEVAAGESWHSFVVYALSHNWYGIENLSLIPGSVGAAPMQNIGAYGVEVGQMIETVTYFDITMQRFQTISAGACRFGYRESIFKHDLKQTAIIWTVQFRLHKIAHPKVEYGDIQKVLSERGIATPTPADVSEAVIAIRKSKLPDPAELGNAGSFFKNPVISMAHYQKLKATYPTIPSYPAGENDVKVPAGWLIENTGWKGKRQGQQGVHERQALVLVNYGGATGHQIYRLALDIQSDVLAKFGIKLHPEVNLV